MLTYTLAGSVRKDTGKTLTKDLRKEGLIPCVLYAASGSIHFSAPVNELLKAIITPDTYLVTLEIDGTTYTAILKDSQFEPVFDNLLHVDFQQVSLDSTIEVELPVRLSGTPEGVLSGGKLVQKMRRAKVTGITKDLPQTVTVDVSDLKLGRSLKVRDVNYDKFKILNSGDVPIATVEIPRALRQDRRG
jgi:large subunit ribosomal protein L25